MPLSASAPPDYVVVGHIAKDLIPGGHRPGGTAAYAALTARALGYRSGLVTAFGPDLEPDSLTALEVARPASALSTTFENIYGPQGRTQFLRAQAARLTALDIPAHWRSPRVAHLAPLAQEFEPGLRTEFEGGFVGLTPQGWLRQWDGAGRVSAAAWPAALDTLRRVSATVISVEDVAGDWSVVERWATAAKILAVTEGERGCTVFAHGAGPRKFPAPRVDVVDPTGAGDIFAAAFFINLYETGDPWGSARFANQ